MNPEPDQTRHWLPNTNVFVSKTGDLIIKVDLSGLLAGDVEVTVENKSLRIKGVRRDSEVGDSRQLLVKEIPAGPFESVLEIPEGFDLSASSSAYLNGLLRIVVPGKDGASGIPQSPQRN